MTMTMTIPCNNSHANGNRPRTSLAGQLDRFDSILDGLDQGLSGAITDAVKDAVSTAVAETVRATIIEIVTNPQVIALFRGLSPAGAATTPAEQTPEPLLQPVSFLGRLRRTLTSASRGTVDKLRAGTQAVVTRVRGVRRGVVGTVQQINSLWRLKWPIVISLAIGMVTGAVSYASSPWLAGTLSGIGAAGAALGAQLALWARRLFIDFSMR